MGVSTDGQLCWGVPFEEDYLFPWDTDDDADGELDEWWRDQQGYDRSKDYPAEGWIEYQKQFDAEHPCPVELVNYCSGGTPMYILAVPSSVRTAKRGYPERLVEWPEVTEAEMRAVDEFCSKYDLTPEHQAGWFLSSYWSAS